MSFGVKISITHITALVAIIIVTTTDGADKVPTAAIVTNGHGCSEIGISILEQGGNAVDALIAAMFCEGVSMPESMGLGGGFLMTGYNKATGTSWSLNSRETAPAAATEDMFHGDSNLSQRGGTAVGVPSELRGYWRLYQKYGGKAPWRNLVQPTIDICFKGVYTTKFLAEIYASRRDLLYSDPVLRDIFINPETNDTYVEGDYVKRPRFAKTLEVIAEEGGDALYTGSLVEDFVKDIQDHGGIITVKDMNDYEPEFQESIVIPLPNNQTLYSSPLPASGVILGYILNILSLFDDLKDPSSITTNQIIVESFKFGFGKRTDLGDTNFNDLTDLIANLTSLSYALETKSSIFTDRTFQNASYYGANTSLVEDHGTAHINILDQYGDAIAATSTINFLFGAGFASNSTGIILNDEMDDFSSPNMTNGFDIPPSPSNYIVPGKRPMSSMCPTLITDENGDVIFVAGSAGGTKIITAVALTIMNHLWFGMDLQSSINVMRLHHQLFPMNIVYEVDYETDIEGQKIVAGLSKIGHQYVYDDDNGFAAVTGIARNSSTKFITAAADRRRQGSISYLYD